VLIVDAEDERVDASNGAPNRAPGTGVAEVCEGLGDGKLTPYAGVADAAGAAEVASADDEPPPATAAAAAAEERGGDSSSPAPAAG
jgi:hypothetical protein